MGLLAWQWAACRLGGQWRPGHEASGRQAPTPLRQQAVVTTLQVVGQLALGAASSLHTFAVLQARGASPFPDLIYCDTYPPEAGGKYEREAEPDPNRS